ncbi:stage III sporulation protein AE [Tissierellaceae bacterium HCP3S3_D8]
MKRIIIVLWIILSFSQCVNGEKIDMEDILNRQIDLTDNVEIDNFLRDLMEENQMSINLNTKDLVSKLIKGEKIMEGTQAIKDIQRIFLKELSISLSLLSKILIITIISAILTNLQGTFEKSSISQFANYFTYILIAILVITNFVQLMDMVRITVDRMINFMQILLPILLTLLVITGGPNTKIIFHPMILGTVNIMGLMVKNIIFPLIYFSFVVSILSNLSNRGELGKLSELGRQVITFIISAAFTVFIGILTIYGLSTKIDGITIRTAKFAVDRFLPVVGGFLSDALDAVVGSSVILKNGIGIIGLITLALIILIPLIKIVVLLLIYSVAGAVIEPIASDNIIEFFSDVSKTLLLLLISMVSIGIMFFITVTIIVDASNNLLMLR